MANLHLKLDQLKQDYFGVTGSYFNHFLCPILHLDEDTELIVGHIINQALPVEENERRGWTIQRKDVDNLFGAIESDFILAQCDEDDAFKQAFLTASLSNQFQPKLTLDGKEIGFFLPKVQLQIIFPPSALK